MSISDRTIAPKIYDAVDFEYQLPPINKQKLQNGIDLYWLNAGVQEVVQIDWIFAAGIWHEQKEGIAQATASLLKNGTSTRTAAQINDALEFYGAELRTTVTNDFATITLYSLRKHLPELLPVVYDLLTDSIFPENELEIYRKNAIQKLMMNLRKSEFVANQQIDAMLYGKEHPYGRYSTIEALTTVTKEDIEQFYKTRFVLTNVLIMMAGKAGDAEAQLINQVFGALVSQANPVAIPAHSIHSSAEKTLRIMNDAESVQGAIRIARHFPNRTHPDFAPMIVLNTVFGGYFGSRLVSNIREDKGYTYGIDSSPVPGLYGGSLVISAETGRDVVDLAIKEVYHEMEVLCNEPVGDEELLLVKNYLLGNILSDLDGPFSILRRWRTLILNGFDESYFNKNISVYKSITPGELIELARKYFVKDEFYEVVVI